MIIRHGTRASVSIDPLPADEFAELVRSFCSDAWEVAHSRAGSEPADVGLPVEHDRALRNMAGLAADAGIDPAVELARSLSQGGVEAFIGAVRERIGVDRRTENRLLGPEGDGPDEALAWLRRTFRDLNDGRILNAPLPLRIVVESPAVVPEVGGFGVEFVDSMGVSDAAIREDLVRVLRDPRCVPVLCARFGEAPPGPALMNLLRHANELGMAPALLRRAVLVLLTRGGEAEEIRDPQTGEPVGERGRGRDLKAQEAKRRLRQMGLGELAVLVLDVAEDEVHDLAVAIGAHVEAERNHRADLLERAVSAALSLGRDELRAERAAAAQVCAAALDRYAAEFGVLALRSRDIEGAVVSGVAGSRPQMVKASVRRHGKWRNLDVLFLTSSGAAAEAGVRSAEAREALSGVIAGLRAHPATCILDGALASLTHRVTGWFEAFLAGAHAAGYEVLGERLRADGALWSRCADRRGRGYVNGVATEIRDWFSDNDRRLLQRALDVKLQQLWERLLIGRVTEAARLLRSMPATSQAASGHPIEVPDDPRLEPDGADYRAFTREFDEEVSPEDIVDREELDRLAGQLEGVVAGLADVHPAPEATGDLEGVAVTLLIDNSGSMRGRPISVAAGLAVLAADALAARGAAIEVLGFTTRAWKGGQSRARWVAAGRPNAPGRLSDVRHIVYQPGSEPWGKQARGRLGAMLADGLLKENIDGEALAWAYRRSLALSATRRAVVLLSDGAPVDATTLSENPEDYLERHLQSVIAAVEEHGLVGLGAIGIGHDVRKYFRRSRVCEELETITSRELVDFIEHVLASHGA